MRKGFRTANKVRQVNRGAAGRALSGGTALLMVLLSATAGRAAAQVDTIPGAVRHLGVVYESYVPTLAISPFTGRFGGLTVAPRVEAVIARDLRYSDRFEMMDSIPLAPGGGAVDYGLWDQFGADWLVTGQVEGLGNRFVLVLELHDVVFSEVKERARFSLPRPEAEDFRMAIHAISDDVVRWITGEPGMAASRICFSMESAAGSQELYVVDSDGENLRRLTNFNSLTMSCSWSPDGSRLAFLSFATGDPAIHEMEIATRRTRVLEFNRAGQPMTPVYHPNGEEIIFSLADGAESGLFSWRVREDCCLWRLTAGRWNDLSPSFSPDGRRLAFNSNRLGVAIPQIYVMPAESGGRPDLVSPYLYGQGGYYTSPDWAPSGDRVAFHGRYRRGSYHILIADVAAQGQRLLQLTYEGNNEDPSWAPDGRHLVFVGERDWGFGLFVVDTVSGRIRPVLSGVRPRVPDWSPSLASTERPTREN